MPDNVSQSLWTRPIRPDEANLSPDAARSILALHFPTADMQRMEALSDKARLGTLSSDEDAELEEYCRAGDVLAIFKSKARLALKERASTI